MACCIQGSMQRYLFTQGSVLPSGGFQPLAIRPMVCTGVWQLRLMKMASYNTEFLENTEWQKNRISCFSMDFSMPGALHLTTSVPQMPGTPPASARIAPNTISLPNVFGTNSHPAENCWIQEMSCTSGLILYNSIFRRTIFISSICQVSLN